MSADMRKLNLAALSLTAGLLASCAPVQTAPAHPEAPYRLQLLHFSDVDGGRDIIGNVPRFSALLNTFRAQQPENTLVVSSGDNWIPGPEYNVAGDSALDAVLGKAGAGRAHVAWLNALGVQASAVGNHDLDMGTAEFAGLLSQGEGWNGAAFPYLSTNLDFAPDEATAKITGKDGLSVTELAGKVAGYATAEVGGQTIGLIGASTPSLGSITNVGKVGVAPAQADDLDALAALIQQDADALMAQGVDKIILLAHMQTINVEQELAPRLRGVDIIVAGGSNTILADDTDRLRTGDTAKGAYPLTFAGKDGAPVLVVNTEGDYTYLGRLVAEFDAQGRVIPASVNAKESGAYATDEQGLRDLGVKVDAASPEVLRVAEALTGALKTRAGNIVGYTNVYLNGERRGVRGQETNLGNLSADANLFYGQQVDPSTAISLKNGGGIRGPIGQCIVPPGSTAATPVCSAPQGTPGISERGQVSQLDLELAFRFNNALSLVTVTGTQLAALLEHGVANVENAAGQFPQVGGLSFAYDASRPAGQRLTDIVIDDANGAAAGTQRVVLMQQGQLNAAAAARSYRMVTLGFLATGGDSYPFPKEGTAEFAALKLTDLLSDKRSGEFTFAADGSEQDALAEYFGARHGSAATAFGAADTPAEADTRIVRR